MDDAISSGIRRRHNFMIGETTAERIKVEVGTAVAPIDRRGAVTRVRGLDMMQGMPAEIEVTAAEIAAFLAELIGQVVGAVMSALEQVAPELAGDIFDQGIVMTGGGSLLPRLDQALGDETGLPVIVAENALTCVAYGAGLAFEDAALRAAIIAT